MCEHFFTDEPRPPKLEVVLDPTGKDREDWAPPPTSEHARYRIAGYFRGVYISRISRKHSQSLKIKIVKKIINVEEAWFSISIREITFREQELNWLFAKYKRLENNPLYTVPYSRYISRV